MRTLTVWWRLLLLDQSRRASGRSVMDCLVEGVPTYGDLALGGRFFGMFWDATQTETSTFQEKSQTIFVLHSNLKHLETLLDTDILEGSTLTDIFLLKDMISFKKNRWVMIMTLKSSIWFLLKTSAAERIFFFQRTNVLQVFLCRVVQLELVTTSWKASKGKAQTLTTKGMDFPGWNGEDPKSLSTWVRKLPAECIRWCHWCRGRW